MLSLLDNIVQITYEAGSLALEYQQNGFKFFKKGYNDIVTDADLAVNDFLKEKLLNLVPNSGWLSEESVDNKDRLSKKLVWIVDPIDGTMQFAKGTDQWVISIALVENNRPIMGVIYNPRKNQMFFAERCLGAFLNDYRIDRGSDTDGKSKKPVLLTTKSKSNFFKLFSHGIQKNFKIEQIGSLAYILALTSLGYSSSCLTFKHFNEWDIAAGFLILKETGCDFNIFGNENSNHFLFNKEDVSYKHGFLAGNKDVFNLLQKKLT